MNLRDTYTEFKKKYHLQTQNLKFEDIISTDINSCIQEMIEKRKEFNHFKKEIKKEKPKLLNKDSDIFFGLYSNTGNCSYKIYLITKVNTNEEKKELIMEGELMENRITYITPILIVCIFFHSLIEVEVSENAFLLFSILERDFRLEMARKPHYIKNFVYLGGVLSLVNDPKNEHSDFPLFTTFGIYEKIDSIHEDNEYKNKYGLELTSEDKKLIMTDFDIFERYLDVKLNKK